MGGSRWGVAGCFVLCAAAGACGSYPSIEGDPLAGPRASLDSAQDPSGATPNSGAGGAKPAPTSPGAPPPPPPSGATKLHAFVTSMTFNGDLGGLAGADAKCAVLATGAGIPGTYRAWLSAGATSPLDRLTSNGPWYLVNGAMVVPSKPQLATGVLTNAIDKDERGATPPLTDDQVWTATDPSGKPFGRDCEAWTSTTDDTVVGEAEHADSRWTVRTDAGCNELKRIYCFQL
jgi:hypothetical protein